MFGRLALGASLVLAASARGQDNYKLNGPLLPPPAVEGDVEDAALSPDGRWVVYLASQDAYDVVELYSVPLDGSSPAVKLNGPLAPGGAIDEFRISPDGAHVVYQADQDEQYVHALYSAPIDGHADPVRLNAPIATHAYFEFEISPDGSRVVFFDTVRFRLYLARIQGGSPPLELPSPLRSGGYLLQCAFSPDGTRIVFNADPDGLSGLNLYSLLLDVDASTGRRVRRWPPGGLLRLDVPLAPGRDILSFRVARGCVVYQVLGGSYPLYSVPLDGSASAVRISAIPAAGGRLTYGDYAVSPDGERVVYRADQQIDEVFELYSVPIGGGSPPVELNAPLIPQGDVEYQGFGISPDSRHVVYRADQERDGVIELYGVPIDGSASAAKLNAPLEPYERVESFRIGADGARVVYLSAWECHRHLELHSVPIDGSCRDVQLNNATQGLCESGEAPGHLEYQISRDSRRVVYLTDCETEDDAGRVSELYVVPIDGGVGGDARIRRVPLEHPIRLNAPLPPGGQVGGGIAGGFAFGISPLGHVVYRAAQEEAGVLELYRVPLERDTAPVKLNPPLALGPPRGDVVQAAICPDGTRVVYRADAETNEVFALFSVPIGGGRSPIRLSPGSVTDFGIAPGSRRVVFLARGEAGQELFSVPIDGGAQPVRLSAPLVPGGDVLSFQVGPGGHLVVYLADQEVDEVSELYGVPIVGGASPVKLSGPLVPGGAVLSCDSEVHPAPHFTPDGLRYLYLADAEVDDVFELYSVVADGSAGPVKLSGALAPGGDVVLFATCFQLGAGGERVVYQADQDANDRFELYSAPTDGSAGPIRLNGPLVAGGDVSFGVDAVQLDPLGQRVVYRADQEEDGRFELFSVPIDASSPPLKLNGALVANGDVSSLAPRISPDGTRVVYRADQESSGRLELYSVPIDASQPPVRLSALPFDNRSVEAFEISPDGRRVVYQADQETGLVFGLYVVPIDGRSPALPLFPASTPVDSFRITADGKQVVFAAFELYIVSIFGQGIPVPLGGPTAGQGEPEFQLAPGGRRVLYLTDQDTPRVRELYASVLPRWRTREH